MWELTSKCPAESIGVADTAQRTIPHPGYLLPASCPCRCGLMRSSQQGGCKALAWSSSGSLPSQPAMLGMITLKLCQVWARGWSWHVARAVVAESWHCEPVR
ncbi:hypothetical protein MHYP_G00357140 [Metynnis hypsauchen]